MGKGNTSRARESAAWTSAHAYMVAATCLLVGLAAGYFLRGLIGPEPRAFAASTGTRPGVMPVKPAGPGAEQRITPQQLKYMAESQAAPLLERLKTDPKNAELLAQVGNLYYDAQQFPLAIDYYQRSLKIRPGNSDVRVDMGTSFWYMGDADRAIEQYKIVLKAEPAKINALMNLGVVQWQGKMDVPAAVAAWEKLLAAHPNFAGKEKVEQLIVQAKKHTSLPLGGKTGKTPSPAGSPGR